LGHRRCRRPIERIGAHMAMPPPDSYTPHDPVMMAEVLALLAPRPGQAVLDATAGSGAATAALLEAVSPGGRVVALDRDPEAVAHCRERFARNAGQVLVIHSNFGAIGEVMGGTEAGGFDQALFDLGVSAHHLAGRAGRGFAFQHDAPLDMRMDPDGGESAQELLASISERELSALIRDLGEDRHHARIARAICRARQEHAVETTAQLARIVSDALPAGPPQRIHPATRTFQALRVHLNNELGELSAALSGLGRIMRPGGRVAFLAYHSLEDRMVKEHFRAGQRGCVCPPRIPVCICGRRPSLRVLTPKPVRPTEAEVRRNPRARSARLRVAEWIGHPASDADGGQS